MRHDAVNTHGMDPEEHAYHGEIPGDYPTGIGGEKRHHNPYSGYEPTDADERAREDVAADDDSGYNWGPAPDPHALHSPGFAEHEVDDHPDPDIGHENKNLPQGHYDDYDHELGNWEHQRGHEDHKQGGILTQADQWPDRVAAIQAGIDYDSPEFAEHARGYAEKNKPAGELVSPNEAHQHRLDTWRANGWQGDPANPRSYPGSGYPESLQAFGHQKRAWGDAPPYEKKPKGPHAPPVGGDVHRMPGKDTGLYGTDENDLYDVYAHPNPKGDGYDVIGPAH